MNLKILFTVQGEGRGHLTQAIVAYELLVEQGYEITGILVGGTRKHRVPEYFRKRIKSPVYRVESFGFVRDKNNKSVRILPSILHAFRHLIKYVHSIRVIREIIKRHQPDLIINFYEPLVGLAHLFKSISLPTVSVAHQYLFLHPDFKFPAVLAPSDRRMLQLYTRLTAFGSNKMLALSMYPLPEDTSYSIVVSPPLIRKEVLEVEPYQGTHLLVYLVNAGYMENIIQWHHRNPATTLHCFTDSKKVKDKWEYSETLTFHALDDLKFLRFMANSAGVVTTAGFESVCEAFFLEKPILMIPVEGHSEQRCNALDAEKCGAGIASEIFDLSLILNRLHVHPEASATFKSWIERFPDLFIKTIESVLPDCSVQKQKAVNEKENSTIFASENYSIE